MKYLEILRANLAALDLSRSAAISEMEAVTTAAGEESRSALTAEETVAFETARSKVASIDVEAAEIESRIVELEAVEARTAAIANRPELQVIRKEDPREILEDRTASPIQLADALTRSLEDKVESPENMAHVRTIAKRHGSDRDWARQLIVRSSDDYTMAWAKLVTGQAHTLTPEEQRASMAVGTTTTGGLMVPTHLDPSVILTNAGSSNAIRGISKVVTMTPAMGNVWHGISSAGVTASWDGELVEVSDDSPTVASPSVTPVVAQAFVQASLISTQDIQGLATEILMMLGDARDRLEGTAHATGTGSGQPKGIFTACDASTTVEIASATAATIALADLHSVYRQVPVRWRARSTWLMNPLYSLAIKALGTAVSASFTTDATKGTAGTLLGAPVVESDDAPTTQTTTVRDNEIIFGDFSNFIIVDLPGSTAIQYVPTLFNTSNNLPDGRQGWFMQWRNGSDASTVAAFRLLQDTTSA